MYFRMLVSMFVALFTSRIVLRQLGEVDFGIYNVAAGLIVVLSFISGSLSTASSRFLSYAIGEGEARKVSSVFSTIIFVNVCMSMIVIVVAETIGVWYVLNVLNFPSGMETTVMFVYQISILNTVLSLMTTPFTSMIIAQERMNIYAYLSVFDVFAKLGIAISLIYVVDKLEYYAVMQCVVTLLLLLIYFGYCRRSNFIDSLSVRPDSSKIKEILGFSGWTLYASGCTVASTQGVNLLLNYIYGVVFNAAYGLTMQAQNAIRSFSLSFQIALNPQLVKTYSSGDLDGHRQLIFRSVRFSFFLVLIVACPIFFNVEKLLDLWLGKYPLQTISFIRWMILAVIINAMANPFGVSVEASGKIGKMSFLAHTVILLTLPVSWILLKFINDPDIPFIALCIAQFISLLWRLYFSKRVAHFRLKELLADSLLPCVYVGGISMICCGILAYFLPDTSFALLALNLIIDFLIILSAAYCFGIKSAERQWVKNTLRARLHMA